MSERIYPVAAHLQPSEGEPVRSVVTETAEAVVVAWTVKPGQRIHPHVHPFGQDTWTVLTGMGRYQVDASGATMPLQAGDIAVAPTGAVHGLLNTGTEDFVFVSVVCPGLAGYESL